jgi:FtsH-binding integral membrane protein
MRTAGIVMTVLGLIALVFVILGLLSNETKGDNLPFLGNSWFIIMAIFWGGAGISLLLTFGKEDSQKR